MDLMSSSPIPPVLEVWFAGCHSDVGGGSVANTVRDSLANIPLQWMVKQVILSQCGIKFDDAALRKARIDISAVVPIVLAQMTPDNTIEAEVGDVAETPVAPQSPPNEEGDREDIPRRRRPIRDVTAQHWPREQDVVADIHDQLRLNPAWWLLEILPAIFAWQNPDGTWKRKLTINFGRPRQIRDPQPLFHDSVRQRMVVPNLSYKPKAKYTSGTEQYID